MNLKKGMSTWIFEDTANRIDYLKSIGDSIKQISEAVKVYPNVIEKYLNGTYVHPSKGIRREKMPRANVDMTATMEKVYSAKNSKIEKIKSTMKEIATKYTEDITELQTELATLESDLDYQTAKNYLKAKTMEIAKV